MKRLLLSLAAALLLVSSFAARRPDGEYRIMTCNIRVTGLEADDPYPERVWENRRDLCIRSIKDQKPDIICLQEVIYDSYDYFVKAFGKDYNYYGFVGPEMDPWTEGYHFIAKNVIFFRKDRFEWVTSGSYWLSETPTLAGSMSWDTNRARHCNWVRLADKKTGRQMRIINTHLDHKSDPARREQIRMIMEECALYAPEMPQILCGDFNAGIKSAPIQYIRTVDGWKEMYEAIHGPEDPGFTCHAFLGEAYQPKTSRRIDFIFYRGDVTVKDALILKDHEGEMYPSDHYFIRADFQL